MSKQYPNAPIPNADLRDARVDQVIAEDVATGMTAKAEVYQSEATRQRHQAAQARRERDQAMMGGAVAREQARNAAFSFYLLLGVLVTSLLIGAIWYAGRRARLAETGQMTSAVVAPQASIPHPMGGAVVNSTTPNPPPAAVFTRAAPPVPAPTTTQNRARNPFIAPPGPRGAQSPVVPNGNGAMTADFNTTNVQTGGKTAPLPPAPVTESTPLQGYIAPTAGNGQ